jgi:hypothetical protein
MPETKIIYDEMYILAIRGARFTAHRFWKR